MHKVDYFGGTQTGGAANMVMLGIAENAARSEGTTLLPSTDLSKHSSRLVDRLKSTGAVDPGASTKVTNSIQFEPEYDLGPAPRELKSRLPEHEVQAGRQTVRGLLRGSQERKPRGQGSLF